MKLAASDVCLLRDGEPQILPKGGACYSISANKHGSGESQCKCDWLDFSGKVFNLDINVKLPNFLSVGDTLKFS